MSDQNRDPEKKRRETQEMPRRGIEPERERSPSSGTIGARTPFDDRLASLVTSFEERIEKFKDYIAELEKRIEELQSAKARTKTTFDELLDFQELTDMVRATLNPEDVVQELLRLTAKFIEYEAMGIFLSNEKDAGLKPLGKPPSALRRIAKSQFDEGIVDWVVKEKRPVVVPWTDSHHNASEQGRKNLVITPMIVGDHSLGIALIVTPRRADDFSEHDLRLLFFAVSHAAVAIQNALQAREIKSTRDFLSNLLENAGDIIFSLDGHGRFSYVNPRIEELGFKKGELLEKHFKTVFSQTEAEMRINSTLQRGVRQVFDLSVPSSGEPARIYTLNLVPLKSTNGSRDGALGIMRNVTEINRLQKKLLESERLAAYTQTVITLNHEINNPLTTVMGNVYLLEKETSKKKDKNISRRLKVIQENCQRIQLVIKKMERIDELKTVSYLGSTKMVDLGKDHGTEENE